MNYNKYQFFTSCFIMTGVWSNLFVNIESKKYLKDKIENNK